MDVVEVTEQKGIPINILTECKANRAIIGFLANLQNL